MLINKKELSDGTILGFWQVDKSEEELLKLLNNISVVKEKIETFTSQKRRLEYIASRVLVKTLLGTEKTIAYNDIGEPYITDGSYHISITHSNLYVGVILHKNKKVAIDVEKISDKVIRTQSKYLSLAEQSFVDRQNMRVHLTTMWCIKEAVYKILDTVAINTINDIEIQPFVPYIDGEVEVVVKIGDRMNTLTANYLVEQDYCKAWIVD